MVNYIPQKGDIVYLDFGPGVGHEQTGRRPTLVVSNSGYNKITGFIVGLPITSKVKNYIFEVPVYCPNTKGSILVDQIKNLDISERKIKFIEKLDQETLDMVIHKIKLII